MSRKRSASCTTQRPDVVLLDVHLPGGLRPPRRPGGARAQRSTCSVRPTPVRFLALSVSDAAEDVIAVIRAGARGYVTKTISGADLAAAIAPGRRRGRRVLTAAGRVRPRRVRAGAGEVATVDDGAGPALRARARGHAAASPAATPTRRSPRSCSSRSRRSRPTCRPCCASCSCPAGNELTRWAADRRLALITARARDSRRSRPSPRAGGGVPTRRGCR